MEDNGFKYTYSSAQNQEVKNIRDKYINSEKSKIEQLKAVSYTHLTLPTILRV